MNEAVELLAAVFPSHSRMLLEEALNHHGGSVDAAAAALLERPLQQASKRPMNRPQSSVKVRASKSWGDLAAAGVVGVPKPAAQLNFRTPGNPNPAQLESCDFPATLSAGTTSAAAQLGTGNLPATQPAGSESVGPPPHTRSWAALPARRSGAQPATPSSSTRTSPTKPPRVPPAAPPANSGLDTAPSLTQQLAEQHPWAGRELVQLVLEATCGDADVAQVLLAEMAGPAETSTRTSGAHTSGTSSRQALPDAVAQPNHAGAGGGGGGASSSCVDGWQQPLSMQHSPSAPQASKVKPQGSAFRDQPEVPAPVASSWQAGGLSEQTVVRATAAGGRLPGAQAHGACKEPAASPAPAGSWQAGAGEQAHALEEAEAEDLYYRYRRSALHLTKQWQHAARGSAAAYAAGDHGEARRLAAEARRLRQESLAAHACAAERIEAANNSGLGLLELDLHGLHASEAVDAVARRLRLLAELAPELRAAASAPSLLQGPAGAGALRVVVGRGTHSSLGDASLPRVVEGWLREAGYSVLARTGALDVQLRRRA